MKARDFCYWLQGYFEVKEGESTVPHDKSLTHQQVAMIKNHLAMVFKYEIDPTFGKPQMQTELDVIHQGLTQAISGKIDPAGFAMKC